MYNVPSTRMFFNRFPNNLVERARACCLAQAYINTYVTFYLTMRRKKTTVVGKCYKYSLLHIVCLLVAYWTGTRYTRFKDLSVLRNRPRRVSRSLAYTQIHTHTYTHILTNVTHFHEPTIESRATCCWPIACALVRGNVEKSTSNTVRVSFHIGTLVKSSIDLSIDLTSDRPFGYPQIAESTELGFLYEFDRFDRVL